MAMNDTPSAWVRLLAGALLAAAVVFVLIQLANKTVIPPLLLQALIATPLAYAVLRWHTRRWVLILGTVAPVLALAGGAPFFVEDLVHPESGWAFVPSILMVLALLVALAAGLAAILRRPDSLARPVALGAGALALAFVAIGLVATLGVEDDPRSDGDIAVVAHKIEYPKTVAAKAGEVGFYIENKDLIRHTFVIDDRDVKIELPGSASRHVTVALTAGTYEFHCDVPGHESMKGTIEVK